MKALCENLLLGVSGAIAAAAIPGYVLFLRRGLVENVRVILTESAAKIVTPATLRAYSGAPVFTDSFAGEAGLYVPHIQLTREADLFLVMPATADVIGKAARGIADDLLSTAILASPAPVVFVPSMNEQMWRNPAVQRNVELARSHGYHVLEPAQGIEIADLQPTFGVMPPLDQIISHLADVVKGKP
jgi:phosphopantothenoylcysteine decarboxylase/phosphopantothenate--cysteine ligase